MSSVSIPHRHSKNEEYQQEIEEYLKFQFLIGTLKTLRVIRWVALKKMFQFLIGTLKTDRPFDFLSILYIVSIPHRHSKNWSGSLP